MKILIMQDDPDVVEVVRLCFELRWRRCQVIEANLGAEGVELVEVESPDLVILDLGLPDMNGFEVCRRIRAFSRVPIVILTTRDSKLDVVKGLEMGADAYITKPFGHVEMLARVQAILRRTRPSLPATARRQLQGPGFARIQRRRVGLGDRSV